MSLDLGSNLGPETAGAEPPPAVGVQGRAEYQAALAGPAGMDLRALQAAPDAIWDAAQAQVDAAAQAVLAERERTGRPVRRDAELVSALRDAEGYRTEVEARETAWAGFGRAARPAFPAEGRRVGCGCPEEPTRRCPHCGYHVCAAHAAERCPRCPGQVRPLHAFNAPETPNPENGDS